MGGRGGWVDEEMIFFCTKVFPFKIDFYFVSGGFWGWWIKGERRAGWMVLSGVIIVLLVDSRLIYKLLFRFLRFVLFLFFSK